MANNRMYLGCSLCPGKKVFVAKYFPSGGWTHWTDNVPDDLYAFMREHSHRSEYGNAFYLEYEEKPEGFTEHNRVQLTDEELANSEQ